MTKNFTPARPEQGKTKEQITKVVIDLSVKRFRTTTPSKKAREQAQKRNLVRGLISAGQTVTENDVPVSRYPADAVRALRQIHRFYPEATRLFIQNGLWTLSPIGVGGV